MSGLQADRRAQALLDPVWDVVARGAAQLPRDPTLSICVGEVPGFSNLVGQTLVLSSKLEGPDVHHPDETQLVPPVDRWRRAAGCVLEACCKLYLSDLVLRPPGTDWTWLGGAIDMTDAVAPDLGLVVPDLAVALNTGSPGQNPRAGVAVLRAWKAMGHDPWARIRYVLDGGVISTKEWIEIGQWVFHPERGPAAAMPVAVPKLAPVDVPTTLPPWSWQPLSVPPHERGGKVELQGPGEVHDPWGVADERLETLAGSVGGEVKLQPGLGGPVGTWTVASAQGFGQVMGARGVTFIFKPSGALDVVMADAFVGPLAALPMAEQVGTSGTATGAWHVGGAHRLRFTGIATQGVTMHGRSADRFMMPAKGFGIGEWLVALEEGLWAWRAVDDRLFLRGQMMGGAVEIRFRRETG